MMQLLISPTPINNLTNLDKWKKWLQKSRLEQLLRLAPMLLPQCVGASFIKYTLLLILTTKGNAPPSMLINSLIFSLNDVGLELCI